jgi:response regulator RpfG family c-di-GMP phosphodiesterase
MTQRDRPQVLIVDDNPANRMAFEVVLGKDYKVTLAESGYQAHELAQREEFAVILLDVRMPMMDGFETAIKLRRLPRTAHTAIIFTSAVDKSESHIKQGFSAGATDYLFSPVDPELLSFKVATYSKLYQRNETLRRQIEELKQVVHSLHAESQKTGTLETRILQLEGVIEELKRQSLEASI